MTQALIDRELLERAASMELDTTARSIRIQDEIRAILAQPPEQSEAVEVVGWRRLDRPYELTAHPSVFAMWHGNGWPVQALYTHPAATVPAGCKVVPVELLERLEHVTRTLVPHLQCHVDLRALLASVEGGE